MNECLKEVICGIEQNTEQYTREWSPRISFALFSCCLLSSSVSLGTPSSSSFSLATHKHIPSVMLKFYSPSKLIEDLFEKHNSLTATLKELRNCFTSVLSIWWENLTQEFSGLYSFLSTLVCSSPIWHISVHVWNKLNCLLFFIMFFNRTFSNSHHWLDLYSQMCECDCKPTTCPHHYIYPGN